MVRNLLLLMLFTCLGSFAMAQTSLSGRIVDTSGEPIISGNVAVYQNGNLVTGNLTDFDGYYSITPLDPGTYEVEYSYLGYATQRQTGVKIFAGKANKLDVELEDEGILLDVVQVIAYKVPLVEQDNTTQGGTLTSDQIKNLPTRDINALAATTAGLSSADEGEEVAVRGSRTDATNYYIDGIRVTGSLVPESEIDQLQIITGGIQAQYGDVTGGIISITTKGPSKQWSGGLEVETSEFFDDFDNRLAGFNISGPLLKNSEGESIIGMRLAGRYTYQYDDDPTAVDVFRVKDSKLAELEANPVISKTSADGNVFNFVAADFLTQDDVETLQANPFEEYTRYDLTAKLDARLGNSIDITFTGAYKRSEDLFTPDELTTTRDDEWRLLNNHNNPLDIQETLRGNFRFRHRLSAPAEEGDETKTGIQNAYYVLQLGYENNLRDISDTRHGHNYFDYGYIGKFDVEWIPTFDVDIATGALSHTDYRQVLRGYTPGEENRVLANYNNILDVPVGEALNSGVGQDLVFINGVATANPDIGLANFIAQNGVVLNQFDNSWNLHKNVGGLYNDARKEDDDLYTFNANSSFDLVGKNNSRHSIQFGILYEQRTERRYRILEPRDLWLVARQQANLHIQGIADGADTIGYKEVFNPFVGAVDTAAIRQLTINEDSDSQFFRRIRERLGLGLDEYVNTDGLTPDQLSLDLFSAKELNDQQVLQYYGYDYLGNEFDGTFDEFFTATDANQVRTFPIAPNRPIYAAAYLQDKFTFRDIIFRVGVRVDRYDANTKVLKDPFSLYEIQGASDYHSGNPDLERPDNIGDDFKVYVNDQGTAVEAYRDENQWYFSNGTPANSPSDIFVGGLVNPAYTDARVEADQNFIKSRGFDPNVSFEDYEPQINWMPRLAFSFPISDQANFFAHYDILVQRPPSNTIATAYDYFYFTELSGLLRNNPDLKPERTVDYEVGFQQQLSESSALKVAAYYKELRDMIQRRTFFPVPIVNSYTTYDNIDFGTIKGFSFQYDLRRTGNISLQANYTLQFADGTGSDADSQRGLTSRGNIRNLIPLNLDERHRIVTSVDYRYGSGNKYNGPKMFGKDILADFGVNFQAIAISGRPYTARLVPTVLGASGFKGAINSARKPWQFTMNLRVDKSFTVNEKLNFNAYIRVSNLLDRRNVIDVYSSTGSPEDDGYLASANGRSDLNSVKNSLREVDSYLASYQWSVLNPDFFSLPRRMYAGIIFDF